MRFRTYTNMPTVKVTPVSGWDMVDVEFGDHDGVTSRIIRLDHLQMCALVNWVKEI